MVEKEILIANLPYSCPEADVQLLGAPSANLGWIWSSLYKRKHLLEILREETTNFSLHLGEGDRKGRSGKMPVPLLGEGRNSRL